MASRRTFLRTIGAAAAAMGASQGRWSRADRQTPTGVTIADIAPNEDVFQYLLRVDGQFNIERYRRILGAANDFKEGDQLVGVAAADELSRTKARELLARTRLRDIDNHPPHEDSLLRLLQQQIEQAARDKTADLTLGELKHFLLTRSAAEIQSIAPGLSSDVIACAVKLMSNQELIAVGSKVFNPLPGSNVGAKGYLGARIQPNSPTDHVEDIRWQVFNGWSFAVGDVVLGTNPVSSDPRAVAAVERTLQDLLVTFELTDALPHCVLAHIDVQAEVERLQPGTTGVWFQSIAGSDSANETFDISVAKMLDYAASRTGPFGLYFETGQGADFTNGHSHGCDMVLLESRKYGFARALSNKVREVRTATGHPGRPWVHVNDVAGFIGPEVFRTREQLVRCCLEDIVMGKLHGLCIGLDVCSTLHMDVSLDDLDWCLDRIVPACPAYLMALPTKIDPMLGYLTTGFQDHVRLREKFDLKVDDRLWRFFQRLEILDQNGRPTAHFGDPAWVYLKYRRAKGDSRDEGSILEEARQAMAAVRGRGVFLASGHGAQTHDLEPNLQRDVQRIYADAKQSIWAEVEPAFVQQLPNVLQQATRSVNREDYILHPESGERLNDASLANVRALRRQYAARFDVQIVVSDGLNALAITDPGHLLPFLTELRRRLGEDGRLPAEPLLLLKSGRVRAGYRIGEELFGGLDGYRVILHVIGERPGTGHHTFSVYITSAPGNQWSERDKVDHNITKVVSGIANTALPPVRGAQEVARILRTLG